MAMARWDGTTGCDKEDECATCNDIGDDGEGATGNDVNNDGDGATGDDINEDGNSRWRQRNEQRRLQQWRWHDG